MSMLSAPQIQLRELFDSQSERYDTHAALELEVGRRLLERLEFQRREPNRLIDLGCGTGQIAAELKRQYRKAEVIGIDFAAGMCRLTRQQSVFLRPVRAVCADLARLPLADRSADVLISNLALQWCDDFKPVFDEFRRVLRPDGLLLFSSLGPDSLFEMRVVSQSLFSGDDLRYFADMHGVGDALMAAGFAEPVMDAEIITLSYGAFDSLLTEMSATGASSHFLHFDQIQNSASKVSAAYGSTPGQSPYRVTWEIIYGAAFGPAEGQPRKTPQGDIATFSVDALKSSRRAGPKSGNGG